MTEHEWLVCNDPEPMLEFLRGKTSDRKLRLFACACCRHAAYILDNEWKRIVNQEQRSDRVAWPSRVFHWLGSKTRPPWPDKGLLEWSKKEADLACRAADLAEQVADGQKDLAELRALLSSPGDDEMEGCYADGPDAAWAAKSSAYRARWCAHYCSPSSYPPGAAYRSPSKPDHDREQAAQAHLLRDVFGNPFHPAAVESIWLTAEVISVAQTIYAERAFDHLPLLAAALERAGCHNQEILCHCREPGLSFQRAEHAASLQTMPHVRGCWVLDLMLGKE
jgi:hypothetical protein